jgi:phosphatidylinositol alpha-mannosyltransferase
VRVALIHAFAWPEVRRGAERLVAELSSSLDRLGHDVTVIASAYDTSSAPRGPVRQVRVQRTSDDVAQAEADFGRRAFPHLVARRFDVVHSFGRRDGVASLKAARLHPRRATVHTEIGIPGRRWWEAMGDEASYVDRVVREVDVYACMSTYSLGRLRAEYGREGVLLPGGVDLEVFRPADRRSETPTILYSGALEEPRKGVASLLEALPLVAAEEPDVRLLLCGPGDAGPLLAAAPPAARERTHVLGPGPLGEQPHRYGTAWVCALPSENETFGLVLVEALACGTPIVAADHAALPELVTPGVTGALSTFGDAASLAKACLEAIALARRSGTVDACRESARPYDWLSGVAPRCVDAYEAARGR